MNFHCSWSLAFKKNVQQRILSLLSSLFIVRLLCCELLSNSRFFLLILLQLSFRFMIMTINIRVILLIARSALSSILFDYRLTALRSWNRWYNCKFSVDYSVCILFTSELFVLDSCSVLSSFFEEATHIPFRLSWFIRCSFF